MKNVNFNGLNLVATTEKLISENYPYGFRLKTTKTDFIEFKPKYGFRHGSQTINPKNNRLNAPKYGTYYTAVLLGKNEDNHTKSLVLDFYGTEGINKDCKTMDIVFDLFTPEQVEYIACQLLVKLFVEVKAKAIYTGSDVERLKAIYSPFIDIVKDIINNKNNRFSEIILPVEQIKSLEIKDFNPFRTQTVLISSVIK